MNDDQRQWLWSLKAEYWEYLAIVLNSWFLSGLLTEAEAFAAGFINDPATPPEGIAILACHLGECRLRNREFATAFSSFERAVRSAPTHIACAPAYYWLAVRSYKNADRVSATRLCNALLTSIGLHASYLWNVVLERKALCLLADFNLDAVSPQLVRHPRAKLKEAKALVLSDLEALIV